MRTKLSSNGPGDRVAREVERERHERTLHDDLRAGLAGSDDLRIKDARESMSAAKLKRSPWR